MKPPPRLKKRQKMPPEKPDRIIPKIIGIFYLVWGITAILNAVYRGDLAPLPWLCYPGILLIGIGALKEDSTLVASQLNILGIPLALWSIDFIYFLINGQSLLGVTDYFFVPGPILGKILTMQHLFTIPLSIYAIYLIRLRNNDAWKISFIQLTAIFFLIRMFTLQEKNINCVFSPCLNINTGLPYPITWFMLAFLMVLIVNFLITRMNFLNERPA